MNRIIIDKDNNELGTIKGNTITLDIKNDVNILIEEDDFDKYIFNVFSSKVNVFINFKNALNKDYEININGGQVKFNNLSINSGSVNINAELNKEESEIIIHNSVISDKDVSYKIRVNHNKKNTNSDIYNNGTTNNNGTIDFDVTSFVPKKSKNCKVNQDSKIISLNDKNNNKINPILLIDEYEVEARHAAFIGNFNNNELFYLMSRGLTKKESQNLLLNGLLIGTLDICFDEKEKIKKRINEC